MLFPTPPSFNLFVWFRSPTMPPWHPVHTSWRSLNAWCSNCYVLVLLLPPWAEGRGCTWRQLPQHLATVPETWGWGTWNSQPDFIEYWSWTCDTGSLVLHTQCFPGNLRESKHVSSWTSVLTSKMLCFYLLPIVRGPWLWNKVDF